MSPYDRIKTDAEAMSKRKAYHAEWQRKNKDKVRSYNNTYRAKKKKPEKHVCVGDTVYYCYELFGEHLVQECTVEEVCLDRGGLKSLKVISVNGHSSYSFSREGRYYLLEEIAFTREKADEWLGG